MPQPNEWVVRRCPVHELIVGSEPRFCPEPGENEFGHCGIELSEPFRVRRAVDGYRIPHILPAEYFDPVAIAGGGNVPYLLVIGERGRIVQFVEDLPPAVVYPEAVWKLIHIDAILISGPDSIRSAISPRRLAQVMYLNRMLVVAHTEEDPELKAAAYAILRLPEDGQDRYMVVRRQWPRAVGPVVQAVQRIRTRRKS